MAASAENYDLIVIGAGPGGYVAAIRAAQLGLNVACVDEYRELGGTCLRVGCIPSKALLESSELYARTRGGLDRHGIRTSGVELDLAALLKRKDRIVSRLTTGVAGLFRNNGVTARRGRARFVAADRIRVDSEEGEAELVAETILVATGSRPASLPGIEFDGDRIGSSTEALAYDSVPEHLVVIGGGYIGLEMGTVWNRLGARVTVLEYLDRILPGTDAEVAAEAQKIFRKQGLEFRLESRVTAARATDDGCVVECEDREPLECDRVLVATGRVPNTAGLDLDAAGLATDDRGFLPVDERFCTAIEGIHAIGDVIGGPLLAHKAMHEAVACVEGIVQGYGHVDYDAIPSVIYTHPEIAAVGLTEERLQDDGREYTAGKFPFRANGRALTLDDTDGFVKILADAETDRVLGVHVIGPRAGDLIAEAAAAMAFGASSEDMARCSHAHPTLSESVGEAALAVGGPTLHL